MHAIPRRLAPFVFLILFAPIAVARTVMDSSPAQRDGFPSATFHREFNAADLQPDDRLVILIAANDGAVISVNGHAVARLNMPTGTIDANTLAVAPADPKNKGMFVRVKVPADLVHPGDKNTIDAAVHAAASPAAAHLACDLMVKTLPPAGPLPSPTPEAKATLELFRKSNYLGPDQHIPDGYFDGGRNMKLDAADHATSGREILLVDRAHDPELTNELAFARSIKALPPVERAHKLAIYIDDLSTPLGGRNVLGPTVTEVEHEFTNQPLRIGDVIDQCHAGVCRHRSLLYKLLADEAGLKVALVRGNYVHLHEGSVIPHAWNELQLDDGRKFLVDSTLRPKSEFPEITSPSVTPKEFAQRYVKVDKSPFYQSSQK